VALAAIGGLVGLLLGIGLAQLIGLFVPALPVHTPLSFVLLAEALAAAIGLAAGVLPARRAALLDPVEALRTEQFLNYIPVPVVQKTPLYRRPQMAYQACESAIFFQAKSHETLHHFTSVFSCPRLRHSLSKIGPKRRVL
jgi:hypothetical protein